MIVLFWEQALYLNSLGSQEEGKKKDFLSLLFLENNQPKIIPLPKRHFLGWHILLPYLLASSQL